MFQAFQPPLRTLLGPGPSGVHPRVLAAMARPTIGHLDPEFIRLMEEIKQLLQYVFQTKNHLTLPVSAPGSAGMEMCFVNLVEPGDKVVVCRNGVFSNRMLENVTRCGGQAICVDAAWGEPVDNDGLERALSAHPDAKLVAFVHAETSTGVVSDAQRIVETAHRHGCLVIMDAVTSLGGIPVRTDEWGVDAVYSGSQKCLSCPPGLSPLTMSDAALQRIKKRRHPVQSWFLDLNLVMGYWGGEQKRTYHHTAPVNALYGLHEALCMVQEEGLERSWERHARMHRALSAGLQAMGLRLRVEESSRLPQLNAVCVPNGVDESTVRTALLNQFGLEIGAGLGELAGKIWRIGLMGQAANARNIIYCLSALEQVLHQQGVDFPLGEAVPAALSVL